MGLALFLLFVSTEGSPLMLVLNSLESLRLTTGELIICAVCRQSKSWQRVRSWTLSWPQIPFPIAQAMFQQCHPTRSSRFRSLLFLHRWSRLRILMNHSRSISIDSIAYNLREMFVLWKARNTRIYISICIVQPQRIQLNRNLGTFSVKKRAPGLETWRRTQITTEA